MRSLQSWLTTSLVMTLVVLFVLIWVGGSYAIGRIVDAQVITRLEHDMEALLGALRFRPDGQIVIDQERLNPVFRKPFSGHYFIIFVEGTVARSRSLWDQELESVTLSPGQTQKRLLLGPSEQELLIMDFGIRKNERDMTISVAADLSPAHTDIRKLQLVFAGLAAALLLLWIAVQRSLVRRGLRPLERVGEEILDIQNGRKNQVEADVPREIHPLVEQINRLTQSMDRRLQRHRTALGNLAHALKTPLTVLMRAGDRMTADTEMRTEIAENTRQISRLIDRELKRARIAGQTGSGQLVQLDKEIQDLVETLKKIHVDKALDVGWSATEDTAISADRDDIVELLGNLLDNAFKWASHRVVVSTQTANQSATITVEDDGEGCTDEEIERLTQRGHRVDESTAGHGLGLSIVSEIVTLYGGQIAFGKSPALGGLLVTVRLPTRTT